MRFPDALFRPRWWHLRFRDSFRLRRSQHVRFWDSHHRRRSRHVEFRDFRFPREKFFGWDRSLFWKGSDIEILPYSLIRNPEELELIWKHLQPITPKTGQPCKNRRLTSWHGALKLLDVGSHITILKSGFSSSPPITTCEIPRCFIPPQMMTFALQGFFPILAIPEFLRQNKNSERFQIPERKILWLR